MQSLLSQMLWRDILYYYKLWMDELIRDPSFGINCQRPVFSLDVSIDHSSIGQLDRRTTLWLPQLVSRKTRWFGPVDRWPIQVDGLPWYTGVQLTAEPSSCMLDELSVLTDWIECNIHKYCLCLLFQIAISLFMLSYETIGIGVLYIGLLTEVHAIFLHSRQLLIMYGISKSSTLYSVHKSTNLVTFVVLRLVPLLFALYCSCTMISRNFFALYYILPCFTAVMCTINFVLLWRLLRSDFLVTNGKDGNILEDWGW